MPWMQRGGGRGGRLVPLARGIRSTMASTMRRCVWCALPSWLKSNSSSNGGSLWLKPVLSVKFTVVGSGQIKQVHLWVCTFFYIVKQTLKLHLPDLEPFLLCTHVLTIKSESSLKALCSQKWNITCCWLSSKNHFLPDCGPLGQLHGIYNGNLVNTKCKSSSLLMA